MGSEHRDAGSIVRWLLYLHKVKTWHVSYNESGTHFPVNPSCYEVSVMVSTKSCALVIDVAE